MTIKIRPEARAKIAHLLSDGLPAIRVDNGYFVDRFSAFIATFEAERELPKSGPNRDSMEAYVDDSPLLEFVLEFIRAELADSRGYVADESQKPLSEIVGYENAEALAARLLDEFERLPREYDVTVQFPIRFFPEEVLEEGAFSLGPQARLSPPDLLFTEKYLLSHQNPLRSSRSKGGGLLNALMIGEPKWVTSEMCFTKSIKGFVGIWGGGAPIEHFEDSLESFLGIGLAKKLFSYEYRVDNSKAKPHFHIHEVNEDKAEFFTSVNSRDDFLEAFRHIKSFEFPMNYPEESKVPWLLGVLRSIDKIFSSSGNEQLLLASKWFFDSYKNSEPMLRYVRQMTCLEILLGYNVNLQKTSLGEIMSNRLAYLIGADIKSRNEIINKFKEIYSLRSRILHQGKHRLATGERALLATLTDYCRRAIDAESELIIAN